MKHEVAINRTLHRRDPTQFPRDPSGAPSPLELIDRMDRSVSAIWFKMGSWTPEKRRANLPEMLNAVSRLEMRLMVMRQGIKREIADSFELVKPSLAGVMPDEDENEGD